jgi:hypothetical protein
MEAVVWAARALHSYQTNKQTNKQISMTSLGRENRPIAYKPTTTTRQQIKILKRNNNNNNNDDQPNPQKPPSEAELKRTLKLREMQYQEAHNRILGENYDQVKPTLVSCDDVTDCQRVSIIRRPTTHALSPQAPLTNRQFDNMLESKHVGDANSQLLTADGKHNEGTSRLHMVDMNLHDINDRNHLCEDRKTNSPVRPLTILGDKNMVANVQPFLWQPPVVMGMASGFTSFPR